MIERKKERTARIAFFSVVHEVYFEQFEGLRESLQHYHEETVRLVEKNGVEVIDYGIIGTNTAAFDTADNINGDKIDLTICNMITYATSSVFAPISFSPSIVSISISPYSSVNFFMNSSSGSGLEK